MTNQQPFPFEMTVEVAFHDLDALGHVNNAVYLVYLETARIKFLMQALDIRTVSELQVILAEATVRYHSPAQFGEQLTIGVGISRFGTKSFDMVYRIAAGDGRLVATARTALVAYDYAANTTIAVPADMKARVLALQGNWHPPA